MHHTVKENRRLRIVFWRELERIILDHGKKLIVMDVWEKKKQWSGLGFQVELAC